MKKIISIILAGILMISLCSCTTGSILDFKITLDGVELQFPMTMEEFKAKGFDYYYDFNKSHDLNPKKYTDIVFKSDKGIVAEFEVSNLNDQPQIVDECTVIGCRINVDNTAAIMVNAKTTVLPNNIELGKSTISDVLKAYGEPNNKDNNWTQYVFDKEKLLPIRRVEMHYTDNILTEIHITNDIKPQ